MSYINIYTCVLCHDVKRGKLYALVCNLALADATCRFRVSFNFTRNIGCTEYAPFVPPVVSF